MNNEKVTKSTQEQAVASWIDYLYQSRIASIIKALTNQDFNLEQSLAELQIIKDFISDPAHILGNPLSKHGEIAENFQVYLSNAIKMITGEATEYTFENVGRIAPVDYLKNGAPVQSKFYHEYANTFKAVCNHLNTYKDFLKNGGTYDIPKNQYESIVDVLFRGDNARSTLHKIEFSIDEEAELLKPNIEFLYSDALGNEWTQRVTIVMNVITGETICENDEPR